MSNIIKVIILYLAAIFAVNTANGHVVAFLGDSNLWLAGDSCADSRSWVSHVVAAMPADTALNYSRSGATWTCPPAYADDTEFYSEVLHPKNTVRNQLLRLERDVNIGKTEPPGIIFIGAGTNDAWFSDRLPGIFDEEQEHTLAGAVRTTLQRISELWPECRVIVVTPPPATKFMPERLTMVSQIIQQAAAPCKPLIVRLDIDCSFNPHPSHGYTADGVHTTQKGAKAVADIILKNLNR